MRPQGLARSAHAAMAAVVAALTIKPRTREELIADTGFGPVSVAACLRHLREAGAVFRIGYRGTNRALTQVFAVQHGPDRMTDAPRPPSRRSKRTEAARVIQWRKAA